MTPQQRYYWKNAEKCRSAARKRYQKNKGRIRTWYKEHPDVRKAEALRRKYGLSLAEYNVLLQVQQRKCRICEREVQPLCVDHDHLTGRVRGLLCRKCNAELGWFEMFRSQVEGYLQ